MHVGEQCSDFHTQRALSHTSLLTSKYKHRYSQSVTRLEVQVNNTNPNTVLRRFFSANTKKYMIWLQYTGQGVRGTSYWTECIRMLHASPARHFSFCAPVLFSPLSNRHTQTHTRTHTQTAFLTPSN